MNDLDFAIQEKAPRAFELLERALTEQEKADLYNVFFRMGLRMNLKDLPVDYSNWLSVITR